MVSRDTARKRAKAKWNAEADEFNQWPELSAEEKERLIKAEMRRLGADV